MRFAYLIPVGLLAAMLGCQGGSEVTGPAAPASTGTPPAPASLQEYVPAAAYAGGGSVAPALEGTLGVWTLHYTNGTAEVTPVRSAAATPGVGTFDVDVTDAFMRSFCGGCVAVESVSINGNGRPVVTVAATHPFELGDPALPPSAQNRRDLFIFNVRGVLAAEADPETIAGVTVSEDLLEDPDGYYPHQGLFPTGTLTADAFPYMVFGVDPPGTGTGNFDNATGQWTDMANPTGFNVLGQGETGTAQFTLDIDPGETREFSLVLVARYGQSVTGRATRLTPEYYSAEFASDPWRVEANEPATPFDQTPTNFQAVTVEVYDFAMAYGAEDPGYPSANHLGLSWDPGLDLELHVPGFRATPFTPSAPPTGTGSLDDPLVYTFSVNNALASPNGDYTALVKVTSNRPVGAAAPGDPDDVNGVNASLDVSDLVQFTEIATYQVFDLEVSQVVGQPPVADLAASKTEIMQGNGIYFFPGPGTTDPDGTITNYYYDFDYDGSTFTNEATNTTGAPVSGRFNTVGTVTVAMRVRDNSNNLSPIDTLAITVVAPGDPFPPANPMNSFTAEASIEMFINADHQVVAYDHNFPGNVYLLSEGTTGSGTNYRIHRSKDFGRTFDAGTPIEAEIKAHPGDSFTWISSHGLTVLADGSLGFVLNTTSTTTSSPPSQGRGVYYVWISADPNGTGVDPGDGTHDVVKVNAANGTFDTYSDANLWADPTDPTRAYVTMHHSPSGFTEDGLLFGNVFSANTANPTTQESTILPYTVGFQLDNNHAWMDRTTGDIHVTWEEFTPSVDRWVAYTRIHLNNPVGPRARLSMMSTVGSISNTGGPTVGVTTGGQAVVAFSADWDPTTGTDFDINLVKVQDNAGTLSFITPVTRLTEPTTGDGKPFILGDRVTGRLTVAFTASATNFQGSSGNRNVKYSIFDANLAPLIPNALPLQTVDPGVTYIHDDPWGAIDQNTGEVIYAWLEEPPIAANEMMAWRYSR